MPHTHLDSWLTSDNVVSRLDPTGRRCRRFGGLPPGGQEVSRCSSRRSAGARPGGQEVSRCSSRRSVGLPPGAQVQLQGHQWISVLQARVEDVKVGPPDPLQVVLQSYLQIPQKKRTEAAHTHCPLNQCFSIGGGPTFFFLWNCVSFKVKAQHFLYEILIF